MKPANSIEFYLKQQNVAYQIVPHSPVNSLEAAAKATRIDPSRVIRAVIMHDDAGVMMLVLPANHLVDFSALRAQFGRTLELVPIDEVADLFVDCRSNAIPPLAGHYGLRAVVDHKIAELDEVYFEAGSNDCLLRMSGGDFRNLYAKAYWGNFSRPSSQLASKVGYEFVVPEGVGRHLAIKGLLPSDDIKTRIERVRQMPPMPDMAGRLIKLKNDPHSTIDDLAQIVALDPSLSAQVVRYARSAFFGYRGEINTIKDAILRVLGFDMVINMALGLALGKSLRIPAGGPLGIDAFWRHAVYSAALCQALSAIVPAPIRPKPDLAYLVGLLHNFGYLLMGQLLKAEFFLLNKVVAANPDVPVTLIEKRLLGVSHTQIGAWLMTAWDMPKEVIVTQSEHHNECYQGDHANYVNLVLLVDCLLKTRGLGDAAADEAPAAILNALGLDAEKVDALVRHILAEKTGLDAMAQQLAA